MLAGEAMGEELLQHAGRRSPAGRGADRGWRAQVGAGGRRGGAGWEGMGREKEASGGWSSEDGRRWLQPPEKPAARGNRTGGRRAKP